MAYRYSVFAFFRKNKNAVDGVLNSRIYPFLASEDKSISRFFFDFWAGDKGCVVSLNRTLKRILKCTLVVSKTQ